MIKVIKRKEKEGKGKRRKKKTNFDEKASWSKNKRFCDGKHFYGLVKIKSKGLAKPGLCFDRCRFSRIFSFREREKTKREIERERGKTDNVVVDTSTRKVRLSDFVLHLLCSDFSLTS